MKKQAKFSVQGRRTDLGPLKIERILPNQFSRKVGPFVMLDYVPPAIKEFISKKGMGAHPHRGIATVTYIVQGEVEHFDSAGNTGKIYSGGAQWMKAGNGVIHDENVNFDRNTESKIVEGYQFWINLPSTNKAENPEHIALQSDEIPLKILPENSGSLKVIVGNYENLKSKIPNYAEQFLYHIQLNASKNFALIFKNEIEVAGFLPKNSAILNETEFQKGDFIEFDNREGEIKIKNNSEKTIDILLFGGEIYFENIVSEGPFVMNSKEEIIDAYRDFHAGKYGKININ